MANHRIAWIASLLLLGAAGTFTRAAEIPVAPGESAQAKLAGLKPGDVLLLKRGSHKGTLNISDLHGTEQAPIVIRGEPDAQLVPTERDGILFFPKPSSHVVVENLRIENAARAGIIVNGSNHIAIRHCTIGNNGVWGIQTTLSDYVTVEDCELFGSKKEHGVYFSTTDHPVARNNRIHDNAGCGIHNNGDKQERAIGMITGGLYENNIIYNCGKRGGAAINMDSVEKSILRNNVIYNNSAGGIVSFHGDGDHAGDANRIYNNTIYFAPGTGRYGIQMSGGKDHQIVNNIVVCGRGPALEIGDGSDRGLASDCNLLLRSRGGEPIEHNGQAMSLAAWRQKSGQDAHSLSADPLLIDPAQGKLGLQPRSPAIGAGKTVDDLKVDATGAKRPAGKAWAIGAYEASATR